MSSEPLRSDDLEKEELRLWDKYEKDDEPDVFGHLSLAKDGGFPEVKAMYYSFRWISAAILMLFVVYNMVYLVGLDCELISDPQRALKDLAGPDTKDPESVVQTVTHSFYFSNHILDWIGNAFFGIEDVSPVRVLGAMELLWLAWYLWLVLLSCYHIKCSEGFKRWHSCQYVFWDVLPILSSYSAMKLLNHIVPSVFLTNLFENIESTKEAIKEKKSYMNQLWLWFSWIFAVIFGFFVGFDTFLLKMRIVAVRSTGPGFSVLSCMQFLVQVLGVVQLGPFVRKRLFVFIFGGEDGILQDEEAELMETWNAMLARRMYRDLPFAHFLAVMMSFSDEDFQALVLNEDSVKKAKEIGT